LNGFERGKQNSKILAFCLLVNNLPIMIRAELCM